MTQRIKRRPKRPLLPWERNRLARNKIQVCRCDALPFPHRRGSGSTVRVGRASIEVKCTP